jgi:hypothetical protein
METNPQSDASLDDIQDVRAYVSAVAHKLTADPAELEELVGDGLAFACECRRKLPFGGSLRGALAAGLESHLRDRWRERHPEWRRNTRAGKTYSVAPTGLAWEQGEAVGVPPLTTDPADLARSRVNLALFREEADLLDPRKMGRYLGMPSAAPLPTAAAREVWTMIEAEREDSGFVVAPRFLFTPRGP